MSQAARSGANPNAGYSPVIPRIGTALALPANERILIRSANATKGNVVVPQIRLPKSKLGYTVQYTR